jgi:hypothetical protein
MWRIFDVAVKPTVLLPAAIPRRGKQVYSPLQQEESLLTLYLAKALV